ncbi:uncharacterized protein F4812DRAFT_416395, partial [Daldinia caldariorum]|uniref:uncharacterized protein n=1 Tax=Daldinia caldariorum TaxID=326644 RepID=UPI002007C4E6
MMTITNGVWTNAGGGIGVTGDSTTTLFFLHFLLLTTYSLVRISLGVTGVQFLRGKTGHRTILPPGRNLFLSYPACYNFFFSIIHNFFFFSLLLLLFLSSYFSCIT